MSIEAVAALAAGVSSIAPATQASATIGQSAAQPALFDSMVSSMQDLSSQMANNTQAVESLAMGDSDALHRVIMNLESTKLKFDLVLQVRNKVLEAYQELMRMQI